MLKNIITPFFLGFAVIFTPSKLLLRPSGGKKVGRDHFNSCHSVKSHDLHQQLEPNLDFKSFEEFEGIWMV